MEFDFPITIENILGEKLTFKKLSNDEKGKYLEVENEEKPNVGPPMHIHFKQDESLTVISGKLGYQIIGEEAKYVNTGETIFFAAGIAHKFWNAGNDILKCKGYIRPPDNIIYFLSQIYKSMNENKGKPGNFDAAFLLTRYKSEFAITEIPPFVQSIIFPVTLFFGKMTGKHKKFKDAPEPIK